jgi:hypothetical protein
VGIDPRGPPGAEGIVRNYTPTPCDNSFPRSAVRREAGGGNQVDDWTIWSKTGGEFPSEDINSSGIRLRPC